jgi:hypothetical protein
MPAPLELVFGDIWGPAHKLSSNGFLYFVIFMNTHIKFI